jgi:hypothetical protein
MFSNESSAIFGRVAGVSSYGVSAVNSFEMIVPYIRQIPPSFPFTIFIPHMHMLKNKQAVGSSVGWTKVPICWLHMVGLERAGIDGTGYRDKAGL